MASFQFDASTVAPQSPASPIPAGTYTAQVVESDLKPMKSGNGTALSLTLQIIDGPYVNRKVWANLNVKHTNPVAQKIGQEQLSALCHAVGVIRMTDSAQLHMKPMKVRVKVKKDEQYGDKNEIGGFEAISSAGFAPMPGGTFPTPPVAANKPAAPAAATPPWAARAA